jgi:hypothetical protein
MSGRNGHRLLGLGIGLALLLATAGVAAAAYGSWTQSGYTQEGQTNEPKDYKTEQMCGDPIICPPRTYYRSASFSKTPNGGATVGILNEAGDWCSEGGGGFPKQTRGWNWLSNRPNTWVSAMTDWVRAQDCTQSHIYLIRGHHNLQAGGGVNFTYTTEIG